MKDAFICDGVRTPIGRYGGSLSAVRADDLAAVPLAALKARNGGLKTEEIDDVILGCANQAGEDNRNVARMAALLAGYGETVSGTTVNRLCGSGMDAVAIAARAIRTGEAQTIVAGGVESMSRAPFVMPKATQAFSRNAEIFDTTIGWRFVNRLIKENWGIDSMPETAENVAAEFDISRADQDAFAVRSQEKATKAQENGRLAQEIVGLDVKVSRKETRFVDKDEHPRAGTTIESLQKLPTPFRADGSVTAGNASGVNDGACALVIASEEAAASQGLTPMARVVATATIGVPPRIMGIGPAPATEKVLKIAGLSLDDMDVIELNEAFAAQGLAVMRQLGLADDDARVNPNGGAIALGHPLGMSGARLVLTAAKELQNTGGRYGLCTMCIGVGQGIAMIIERV